MDESITHQPKCVGLQDTQAGMEKDIKGKFCVTEKNWPVDKDLQQARYKGD